MIWIEGRKYHHWAVGSFVILSVFGVVLRMMHLIALPSLNYSFLLHAHSHFAFAGWIFLAIALLVVKKLSPQKSTFAETIFILTLISSFGMLISFSLQGYKAISIGFSTLFIIVSYLFIGYVLRSANLRTVWNPVSLKLLKFSLFFLGLSSFGPFALGPLAAAGQKGGYWYHNAIYFYLHFQMNGWMFFAVLSLLANRFLDATALGRNSNIRLGVFGGSTLFVYFIFTLWRDASPVFVVLALCGAVINLLSWISLIVEFRAARNKISFLTKMALLAMSIKTAFQVFVCIPLIGEWVFSERNLIIGYIHLITLGCIVPILLDEFLKVGFIKPGSKLHRLNIVYISSVIAYLVLLFGQPLLSSFRISIPHVDLILLLLSIVLTMISTGYFLLLRRKESL